jgi:hypothetical protein
LSEHTIATARTIEQKISDAGPFDQRIDPHVLTRVRNGMVAQGEICIKRHIGIDWYALAVAEPTALESRLADQAETIKELDDHGDDTLYSKEEPPQHLGSRHLNGDRRLDFLTQASSGEWLGLECKNIREWLYPDRAELREMIGKCLELDCVPVIIARRIPYVTFRLLQPCGVIVHQTYNQLFPLSDQALADRARHKRNLGYHDIRVDNVPDARLLKFIGKNLPGDR